MPETLNQKIGKRLKALRKQEGYTTSQLAQLFNISIEHYRRIECGRHVMGPDKFVLLFEYLGVDPLYLLTGKNREIGLPAGGSVPLTTTISDEHQRETLQELFGYCNALVEVG